jgi:hypothetical protein
LWRTDDDNNEWWLGVFRARWEADMRDTEGLIGAPTSRNTLGRDRWWAGEGRTLDAVLDHIRAGGERLEMPPSPPRRPPPPARRQWLGGTMTASSSSRSSSSGPARSERSTLRASPYATPKREELSPPPRRNRGIVINEPRRAEPPTGRLRLRRPKPEPEEEDASAKLAAYLDAQRLMSSSDDPKDTPGLGTAYMLSVNDPSNWVGSIEDAIAASLADAPPPAPAPARHQAPFVDLTLDDGGAGCSSGAGPSGVKKEEPDDDDELPGCSSRATRERRWFSRYGGGY